MFSDSEIAICYIESCHAQHVYGVPKVNIMFLQTSEILRRMRVVLPVRVIPGAPYAPVQLAMFVK